MNYSLFCLICKVSQGKGKSEYLTVFELLNAMVMALDDLEFKWPTEGLNVKS